jgi:hypothetical protein
MSNSVNGISSCSPYNTTMKLMFGHLYIWGNTHHSSRSKAYQHLVGTEIMHPDSQKKEKKEMMHLAFGFSYKPSY